MLRFSKTQRTANNGRTGLRRRLFAWLHAKGVDSYNQLVAERKRTLFRDLSGDVLEIGAGSGANLAYFPPQINWIALEPNLHMHSYLQQMAQAMGRSVVVHSGAAEHLDLPGESVDAVVSTLTLCSVDDPQQVLQEILRVLKPGGQFVFIEHVAAEEQSRLRRIQNWIEPLWSFVADGCHPNRETARTLEQAGFAQVEYARFHVDAPITGPHIAGVAHKAFAPRAA